MGGREKFNSKSDGDKTAGAADHHKRDAELGNVAATQRRVDKAEDYIPEGHMSLMSEEELEKVNADLLPRAQHFQAQPFSFNELMNMKPQVAPIEEAFDKVRVFNGGSTFNWESFGNMMEFQIPLVIWSSNIKENDIKTRCRMDFCFMHQPGCCYVYQPQVPLVYLRPVPKTRYMPMFEMESRSFYTFKFAWRSLLDFGVSDYRDQIGDATKLTTWTNRNMELIQRPFNCVY
jgi:hypothetical protein